MPKGRHFGSQNGTKVESEYTNPEGLERAIERFSGLGDDGRVEFILSHVGTADAAATEAALQLTASHDNVWLELSALGQDMIFDLEGNESSVEGPQYPWIIEDAQTGKLFVKQFQSLVRNRWPIRQQVRGPRAHDARKKANKIQCVM